MPKLKEMNPQGNPICLDSLEILEEIYLSLEDILHNPNDGICNSRLGNASSKLHSCQVTIGGLINTIREARTNERAIN